MRLCTTVRVVEEQLLCRCKGSTPSVEPDGAERALKCTGLGIFLNRGVRGDDCILGWKAVNSACVWEDTYEKPGAVEGVLKIVSADSLQDIAI
jgi:hypothetical protein